MQNEKNKSMMKNDKIAVNPFARHNARRYALQAIYQWQLAQTPISIIEDEFLRYHITKKIDLVYFKELIRGVIEHQAEIDLKMQPHLTRQLKEIDPIELAVLRLAIYELIKRIDIPYRIIINEALELTKKFGAKESYKFINSILDRVAKKNRLIEIGTNHGSPS